MAPSAKGKEKVIYSKESAKRKRIIAEDNDGNGKKRNRAVLQFIEDAAYQVDEDESSDEDSVFDDADFEDEEFDDQVQAPFEPVKADPRTPKQERVSEEDFDKIMENRYKPGSGFVAYEEDKYETKNLVDETPYPTLATDAVIWKVKCTVGRERRSVFCLMQKYLDLKYLGTKLHTLSAFALDHVKGFIFIEADKQSYIYEACNGICSIYSTRATVVPKDELSLLFSVRSKGNGISEGMWARVKNGKYRGDLAQVVAVNDGRKKVTVKLIPRIDLRALAEKFGRGAKVDKNVIPAPRLISASELEEFRPLIQYRRDRDTNKVFEVLDGMMFKDGYLFKKVSADSLSLWGVTPTEDELLKFEPSKVDEGNDDEWLTQLYGGRKKKSRPILIGKGSGKGEGSSSTTLEMNFEVHDLVFFWRKDFGVIIGTEKDDTFKIIKDGSEGPLTVTVKQNELRSADFDKKLFTALDQHGNKISINDNVRVVDGPLKDREGVVKRIYRGIVFIYNEASEENNGYICVKTQMCEKLESSVGLFTEKGGGPGISSFGDHSSPKSPLSPQISQQEDRSNKFDNKDDDAVYSIGQSLRIRVGPLKGYLCRVLAIRRSDVTVKLDSKHKIITVKCEHLSEVRGRSAGISLGGDSDPVKPFEPREQDGSGDWMAGSTNASEGGNWNSGGSATERSSWGAFPTSNPSVQADSSKLPEEAADKDDSWTAKPTSAGGSSWGAAAATPAAGGSSWGAAAATPAAGGSSWGAAAATPAAGGSSWGATAATPAAGGSSWSGAAAAQGTTSQPEGNNWNKAKTAEQGNDGWGCVKKTDENTRPWGKAASDMGGQSGGWNKTTESTDGGSALNDTFGGTGNRADGGSSSWSKPGGGGSSSWNKPAGGFSSTERDLTVGDNTSGWGDKSTNKNEGDGGGGDVWNKKKSSEGVSSSVWGQVKGTETSNWNSQNDLSCKTDGNAGDWSSKIVHKEGSSSGWGQAKRLETSNSGGNQNSWGAHKSDNLQNSFGGGDDQSVPHDDKGRGGGQRGGRGGRWGSGRGRFGGNGMDSERDGGSWSGNKSYPVNQDSWGPKKDNFGRSDGNNGGGWSSKKSAGGEGDAGAWGVSKSSEGGLSSGWGKDNTAGKSTAAGNQDSWGNKICVKPDKDIGGNEGGSNGGWNSKKPVDGRSSSGWGINKSDGTNDAGAHQDSWGSKSNVEGGSSSGWGQSKQGGTADIGGSEDTWGKKTNADWGKSSGWGKTATDAGGSTDNWGKKNDGDGGPSSGWGQSKWGGAADAGGSGETWGKKSTWNSDSDNNLGGNEEDTGRGGGNWRGGSGGRWSSDRGRFGGRSDSDRGGYGGGRGRSDRGGFGGRGGSDRGGFGGRYGSDEGGGFRGRGRSDRGGLRGGRDGSDRGGFRGRGGFGDRGRGRSSQNDSGEDKPYSWNSTADKGASWSSGNGGGSWGEKQNDNNGKWQSGSAGWNSSQGASGDGGNSQAGGWNRGSGSTLDSGADAKPSSWKNSSEGNGAGWSSNTSGGSWNSGDKGKKVAQGSSSDWNQSKGPSKDGGDGGNTGATGGWKAANSSGGGTSSTWGGQKADGEGDGSGSGSGAASWGKAPSASWNQASGGSGKGGW